MLVLILAGTATALATGLGAIPVFLLGERAEALRPLLLGFAAGVMGVASVVGLLLPGIDEGSVGSVGAGLAAGVAFLLVTRRAMRSRRPHVGRCAAPASGRRCSCSRSCSSTACRRDLRSGPRTPPTPPA